MENKEISQHFKLLGNLLELHGENPFKTRSYSNAAFQISRLSTRLSEMPEEEIAAQKGFGKAITEKIKVMLATSELPQLNKLIEATPPGLLELIGLKGLGPKKLAVLWKELGIESAGELMYACNENHLTLLKGFGEKTQENIKKALEFRDQNKNKLHYYTADQIADQLIVQLSEAGISNISKTGALRRKVNVMEKLEFVIDQADKEKVEQVLKSLGYDTEEENNQLIATGEQRPQLEINLPSKDSYNYILFKTSGSEAHLDKLGDIAEQSYESEEAIYQSLGMKYVEPEIREGIGEIELAKKDSLPDLVKTEDIKGIVHNHSTYSDGKNTVAEMAQACIDLGYEYFVISDHSKSAFYAGGLTEAEIEQQHAEVDALNEKLAPFRIFKSIESDILNDGSLDYEDGVLSSFDLVIASVHSNLKMPEEKAMNRLIKAIENPYTNIIGHMTSRILLARDGYPIDHKKIIDACVANNVVIELNANPHRLDMDWRYIPYALEKGAMISINPDAHSVEGIKDVHYGVCSARKGLLTAKSTVNTYGPDDFLNLIKKNN